MAFDGADDLLDNDELAFLNDMLNDNNHDSDPFTDFDAPDPPSFQRDVMNHVPLPRSPRSPVPSGTKSRKCTEIYLGGTSITPGMTSFPDDPHFCSNLSCLSCDHIVIRFPDSRWAPETDYLFLRNNYPNRVDRNLKRAPGWCAFCCQCTFREEKDLKRLNPFSSNWVCRGHY